MELRGDRVVLRPLAEEDVARLVELGAHPDVKRWWPIITADDLLVKARGEDDEVAAFAIVVTIAATLAPAYRASQVNPLAALRYE